MTGMAGSSLSPKALDSAAAFPNSDSEEQLPALTLTQHALELQEQRLANV